MIGRDLLSDHIVVIGDSHAWGAWTTGNSGTTSAPDNFQSMSFANRLRRELGLICCGQIDFRSVAPGCAEYRRAEVVDVCNNPGVSISGSYVISTSAGTPGVVRRFVDLSPGASLSLSLVGDNIGVLYGGNASGFQVSVDGAVTSVAASPIAWGNHLVIGGHTFGRHSLSVSNSGAGNLSVQCVTFRRTMRLDNKGISGTATKNWLPGGPYLAAAVPETATHVVVCLGYNDRIASAHLGATNQPDFPFRTRENLSSILDWIQENRPLAEIILCTPPAAVDSMDFPSKLTYAYSTGEVANIVRSAASQRGIKLADLHKVTRELIRDNVSWLSDTQHMNDVGHDVAFKAILGEIIR